MAKIGTSPAEAPRRANALRTIASRELVDHLISLRFLAIALLIIFTTPLAVYVGIRDYTYRLSDYSRLLAERQELVLSLEEIRGREDDLKALRALRPPEPLSSLVRGLDSVLPVYWDFSPSGIESGPTASRPQRLAHLLGQFDLEFVVRVVLGLLAVLLAFDAVSGEKELGTLRAVLSHSVSRPAFLGGKLAGAGITLLVPLAAAFLLALITAQILGPNVISADALGKIALVAACSAVYLICFYALGLLVSCLSTNQKTSLVLILIIWVVSVLAVPPVSTLLAEAIAPVPPIHAVEAQRRGINANLRRESEQAMGAVYREVTGHPENWVDSQVYHRHREEIHSRIAPIVAKYLNKRRELIDQVEREVERRADKQNRIAGVLMAISPAVVFANAATDLAGTGDGHHAAWVDAVRRYQARLNSLLFENPPTVVIRNKYAAIATDRRKPPSIADLPAFAPPRGDAVATAARSLPALGLLVLYAGLFITGSFIAFSRYDVR